MLGYSRDALNSIIDDFDIQYTISDQLFFETLLNEIRGKTISYSTYIKRERVKQEKNLQKKYKN